MTSMPPPGGRQRWGAYSLNAGAPAQAGRAEGLTPLGRRSLRAAAGLSLLLLLVIANYALHGDENPFNPIAKAAERTQRAGGGRLSVEVVYTSSALSGPVVATGGGAFDARSGHTRTTLIVPGSGFGTNEVEMVADERTVYIRSPEISRDLPPGRAWLGIQPLLGRGKATALAGNGGAGSELEMLRAVSDDVESLGGATVRGKVTERYRGAVDLSHLAALLEEEGRGTLARQYEQAAKVAPEPVEVEVWVDERGIVRKVRTVTTTPTSPARPALTIDTRVEMFGFGHSPRIRLPRPHRVFDATPIARAELGLLDGRSLGPRVPSPSAPALSAGTLRRRANAICAGLLERSARQAAESKATIETLQGIDEGDHPSAVLRAFRGYALDVLEPLLRIYDPGLGKLSALTPPSELAPDYALFLRTSAVSAELFEAAARAYEIGEVELGVKLERRARRLADESDRPSERLGLDACIGEEGQNAGGPA